MVHLQGSGLCVGHANDALYGVKLMAEKQPQSKKIRHAARDLECDRDEVKWEDIRKYLSLWCRFDGKAD